jgi:D-3-phosphoglycerate dehydrogenase
MKEWSNHTILVIDEVHEVFFEKIEGSTINYSPNITIEELPDALTNATILVLRSKLMLDKKWIDLAPKLQVIGRLGSGMDNIDLAYANQKGIACLNAPEGNRNAVAEQTIGMMLGLVTHTVKSNNEIGQGKWLRRENQGLELKNLTVGIIGYGNVGKELAYKLRVFGCDVIAYDKYLKNFGDDFVREVTLEELQQKSDVITLHVPLNESSKNMVNRGFIDSVSKPFYLLNLSRGQVVNIPDLILHLKSGKVLGAGLDVLPNENLSSYTEKEKKELELLNQNDKVILTPHTGGLTKDSFKLLAEVLANKISTHI